ncbi:transporter substrate-binding domain-containing protein [Pseudomonas hefeiensis]|uniref:Transporter substrate-binding domain-containing protein n=1 Tax=Pseudomonas hefeiensis TaxID=2738125 RepID=A0ABY9GHV6_9PSED|nr:MULTISPECIES: transporter substrate-binding domain-containing protein [unclassified Pseudomonas]WLH15025.1 transporter substrate-binding domain-containing protein [Pseudomonas sp. FP205]WLH98072.1 transporter substrate-binding domain-containing protein [Pseudomonas sp. FP53]WLI42348.1 transporter substrate-binding domain-containing protein [Pseudomonas sp. FP821]
MILPLNRLLMCCVLMFLAASAAVPNAAAETALRIVTEELPPYNMTQNGRVTGMSTEVVQAVLKEVGVEASIQPMPWARAYELALNESNVLIYSIARTPAREALFQWVGAIAPTQWYLYSLAERPVKLNSLEDAHGHQIATVNQDVGEQYLVSEGFRIGKDLQSSNKYEHNYRKLKVDHVELWISNELNALYLTRQNGEDPDKVLVRSLALPELSSQDGLSMAFSRKTPAATVERFRSALETIRRNGVYDAIMRKWL